MSGTGQRGAHAGHFGAGALLLAGAMLLASLPAAAQTAAPGAKPAAPDPKTDPLCASYGAGFVRLAGTSTCVKITGSVQGDFYATDVNSAGRVNALTPGLKSK
ncbi:MAG: hypothetical protein E2577_20050 [Starkeya sp.]|nr:hypothetical protein [Starkeya sp.]